MPGVFFVVDDDFFGKAKALLQLVPDHART